MLRVEAMAHVGFHVTSWSVFVGLAANSGELADALFYLGGP